MTPTAARRAVGHLQKTYPISERRACRLAGAHRAMVRYRRRVKPDEAAIRERVRLLAGQRPRWGYYAVHASAYTAALFLAGIFGERPKSGKEVILATQRALEQQALESWQLQKQAQIEELRRRGEPLGAIAAALASPETAERIAVLEAATSGQMSALDAARLNMQRAGHDLSLLDGLRSVGTDFTQDGTSSAIEAATEFLAPFVAGPRN